MVAFSCSEKRRRRSVSGVDRRHYGWHETLLNAVHALPGDTLAEKFRNYSENFLNPLCEAGKIFFRGVSPHGGTIYMQRSWFASASANYECELKLALKGLSLSRFVAPHTVMSELVAVFATECLARCGFRPQCGGGVWGAMACGSGCAIRAWSCRTHA